jgi:quinoprotein glucose dehydrogenase
VWPIEERPVPKSTIPGEETWPTQPFPTKPPAFDRQGSSEADLIDYTPELHKQAMEIASHYVMGPLFTPPIIRSDDPDGKRGVLEIPGGWGAGNWNTGAFDPESGMYYAISQTQAGGNGLTKNPDPDNPMQYGSGQPPRTPAQQAADAEAGRGGGRGRGRQGQGQQAAGRGNALSIDGLPIYKGPYGRITALDLNHGTMAWMVPNGDGPRNHPLLKGLNVGPLGNVGRPVALVTKTLLFVGDSSDAVMGRGGVAGEAQFRAYDKATGAVIAALPIPVGTTGGSMTYMAGGKQYIVLPVGGAATAAVGLRWPFRKACAPGGADFRSVAMSVRLTKGHENIRAAHVGQVVNLRPIGNRPPRVGANLRDDGKVFSTVPAFHPGRLT